MCGNQWGVFDKRSGACSRWSSLTRRVRLPDYTASFWDLSRQFVEQNVTNRPNPLFLEYYMYAGDDDITGVEWHT